MRQRDDGVSNIQENENSCLSDSKAITFPSNDTPNITFEHGSKLSSSLEAEHRFVISQ